MTNPVWAHPALAYLFISIRRLCASGSERGTRKFASILGALRPNPRPLSLWANSMRNARESPLPPAVVTGSLDTLLGRISLGPQTRRTYRVWEGLPHVVFYAWRPEPALPASIPSAAAVSWHGRRRRLSPDSEGRCASGPCSRVMLLAKSGKAKGPGTASPVVGHPPPRSTHRPDGLKCCCSMRPFPAGISLPSCLYARIISCKASGSMARHSSRSLPTIRPGWSSRQGEPRARRSRTMSGESAQKIESFGGTTWMGVVQYRLVGRLFDLRI